MPSLEPIGFWSYARSDDAASNGRLSTLRRLLRDELKLHWGRREVRLWQDVEAIAFGVTWLAEIERALGESSFFIPIVTRAFLESEMCCQEVMLFRTREAELDRDDLIFPFHFMDVTNVRAEECADPAVLPLLKARQAFDFSKLRLRHPESEEVVTNLARLAVAVDAALRRAPRTPSSRAGPAGATVSPDPAVAIPVVPPAPLSAEPGRPVAASDVAVRPPPDPPKPAWASAAGTDQFGSYADIDFHAGHGEVVTQRLRFIPPGRFMMGSPADEPGRYDNEGPRHAVTIRDGFWLFDTPCTQALWQAVMGDNPSYFQSPTRPVEQVSFADAKRFLATVNASVPGLNLSLPSEACWEYACRAGTETATYAGPIEILGQCNAPVLDEIAWYGGNSGVGFELNDGVHSKDWPEKQYPHEKAGTRLVGTREPNAWGLYDMLGNVWEWCEDSWHENYDGAPTDGTAWTSGGAARRVLRGGSWGDDAEVTRAACRLWDGPDGRGDYLGFRCARALV